MKKVAIILIAVLVIFGSSYYYFIGTPSYSLYQTKKAIQNHDSVSFNKYVDMDRVAGSLFDSASKDFDDEMKKQENPFGIFGKGMIDAMIPGLKEQIKNEINKSIEEISEGNGSGFTDTKIKEIFEEGKSAKVILINSDNETIELSMIQFPERYWRVVKINLDDFKKINPNVIKNSDTSSKNNPESDEIIIDRKVGDDVELTTMKLKFNTIDEKQSINRKYGDVKKAKENTKFILINLTVTKITKEGFSFD